MPVCCFGCCYCDLIPDCLDQGCCGKMFAICCCKFNESTNFAHNDPDKCCCGCCSRPKCCDFDDCRFNYCMCKCCSGNIIMDPCACCCGEYKGNLEFAEKRVIAAKGAPAVQEVER